MSVFTGVEAKITVLNLIQLAYKHDKGATAAIVKSGDSYFMSVDNKGEVTLTGIAGGRLVFSGGKVIDSIGIKLNKATVSFTNGDGGDINFDASFEIARGSKIRVKGTFDVFKLIQSCSGLLCHAARLLHGRDEVIRRASEEALQ
ncbi:MAG: hypothetical protein P8X74_12400 [Reinekea sp.]|jgi:hypothetical protein